MSIIGQLSWREDRFTPFRQIEETIVNDILFRQDGYGHHVLVETRRQLARWVADRLRREHVVSTREAPVTRIFEIRLMPNHRGAAAFWPDSDDSGDDDEGGPGGKRKRGKGGKGKGGKRGGKRQGGTGRGGGGQGSTVA